MQIYRQLIVRGLVQPPLKKGIARQFAEFVHFPEAIKQPQIQQQSKQKTDGVQKVVHRHAHSKLIKGDSPVEKGQHYGTDPVLCGSQYRQYAYGDTEEQGDDLQDHRGGKLAAGVMLGDGDIVCPSGGDQSHCDNGDGDEDDGIAQIPPQGTAEAAVQPAHLLSGGIIMGKAQFFFRIVSSSGCHALLLSWVYRMLPEQAHRPG